MRETGHRALRLRPAENRNPPARPLFDALGAGKILFLQTQQADVACVAGREAGNLHVIAHQIFFGRELIVFALEKRLLEIPARPPAQH